tara:strand:+ start:51 stop:197 length:147 start_codon:yes stop_codon:yes gene_type:complete
MKNNDLKIMIIATTIFIIIAVGFQRASDALKNRIEESEIHQLINKFSK